MSDEKEVAVIEVKEIQPAHDRLIELALSENVGLDKLEKLMDLKERNEQNEAKKAYHVAMSAFKANPPEINKDAKVRYENRDGTITGYDHATLGNVAEKINKALSIHGLSAGWKTNQADGKVIVTCTITHILGYSESTTLEAPPDSSGKKNTIQAIGSTVTFLSRYTILTLTGLATVGQDDDGDGAENIEKIIESQIADIDALIEEVAGDKVKFLDYFEIEALSDLPLEKYGSAVKLLEAKRK